MTVVGTNWDTDQTKNLTVYSKYPCQMHKNNMVSFSAGRKSFGNGCSKVALSKCFVDIKPHACCVTAFDKILLTSLEVSGIKERSCK